MRWVSFFVAQTLANSWTMKPSGNSIHHWIKDPLSSSAALNLWQLLTQRSFLVTQTQFRSKLSFYMALALNDEFQVSSKPRIQRGSIIWRTTALTPSKTFARSNHFRWLLSKLLTFHSKDGDDGSDDTDVIVKIFQVFQSPSNHTVQYYTSPWLWHLQSC